uniref:Translocon-associated protein subunit alpha n=1 Tax=Gasterosteus aculeatus aculeatus TaxID=481459 RepID=G3N5V9_GASAC
DVDDEDEAAAETNLFVYRRKKKRKRRRRRSERGKASPNADTTILFVKGDDFPANEIVKFLLGFSNKGPENFVVESLDASFRYPQDYQFYIQNFTALQLGIEVPASRQATFEYSFIPDANVSPGNIFQDAVFNQTVTITEREDGLDGETSWVLFLYVFLSGLGLLVVVGLHQLIESRKRRRPAPKVEMGTSSHNDVDLSWIPQETLNQINKASPRRSPRKRNQKRSAGSDE